MPLRATWRCAGVPLKAIQELMGHSTIEMTMRYAHLSPDVKKDAVQLLDRRSYGNLTATGAVLAANTAKRAQKRRPRRDSNPISAIKLNMRRRTPFCCFALPSGGLGRKSLFTLSLVRVHQST